MSLFIKSVGCECPGCSSDPCDPPEPPAPTLVCDSISASKSKCGYPEWSGYESTPPKYYTRSTISGGHVQDTWSDHPDCTGTCVSRLTYDYSGYCEIPRDTCEETNVSANAHAIDYSDCGTTILSESDAADCGLSSSFGPENFTFSYTSTTMSLAGALCGMTSDAAITRSIEYTTALLISDAEGALPSYPDTWDGTYSAYRNLSTDELTYTVRRFKYKFLLPDLTGYTCYKLVWMEGGVSKFYLWDGSATETPEYGPVLEPGSNGTVGISGVTAECACA